MPIFSMHLFYGYLQQIALHEPNFLYSNISGDPKCDLRFVSSLSIYITLLDKLFELGQLIVEHYLCMWQNNL
jgi:hypothetical protein